MLKTLSEIELLDTANRTKTLSDYFMEMDYTLVVFYRGDW